ncbi:hypothetical protein IMG5_182290 [Ichthyophthirius multifiliis]|uniref:aspartyl aminopeptidase n=1 Tax=Ichthyophthirius multifiliis TaxID=5932 RepID=G0R313_ICHMU|nr:hypothetical protein IMG5_182290 [Ichthyophthirius multifiliis]EGR28145.1 hypothetical protein IMG5_182290 [Ichthyophthirius multifiliis]|eukprot:XP_004027490.1 hypothetical protein IMG5_182290 [Ichthyophthirius multifiliis]
MSYINKENEENSKRDHFEGLLNEISEQIKIPIKQILDLDLFFSDNQQGQIIGFNQEFISAARIDNLFSCWAAVKAFQECKQDENQHSINLICLFDHEECGSQSSKGAGSNLLNQTLQRIWKTLKQTNVQQDSLEKAFANSFLVSADMAHSIHPNYADCHKQNHQVKLNEGIIIKTNHNQRYSTDSFTSSFVKQIANSGNIPYQEFIVKNGSPCGSTIGPIVSSNTGIKSVDLGTGSWGMHSIRETCGSLDSYYYFQFMKLFLEFNYDFK